MKHSTAFLLLSFILLTACFEHEKKTEQNVSEPLVTSTYYFIRHAEKDRTDPKDPNPHLTPEGLQRAERWSKLFGKTKFDAVYSTNYNRTIETAKPTADKNHLEITIYDPNKLDIETFKANTKGKNILVVGHSNTIPQFVNKMIGKDTYEDIDDGNNGNFYMVTIVNDDIIDKLYSMD